MSGHVYTAAGAMPRRYAVGNSAARKPSAAGALSIAALCVVGLALTWIVAALVPATHVRDAVALHDFTLLSRPHVDVLANLLLDLLDPALFTLWAVLLIAFALSRGRPRVALAVACVMGFAPLTAETLKPLLAYPHAQIGYTYIDPASWPSGHATAAVALVLCAVLVAPVWLRPAVATLGGVFAVAVGCSLLILAWHMPSDVLGGYLVASLWMALAVAALRATDRRAAIRRGESARISQGSRRRSARPDPTTPRVPRSPRG
ncbi:MAG TPA: phosphatase PAP2 family protein [Solirubrobacteraceae bacterium]|jgi:membrane-associated phospholipid phosphatase